ncbi:secretory calcium-binding phosphoprotein 9 [Alosa sapidissima]|uniref:secretory calcium-binding phosphoprotein 9 n=1 Tax=Alosa sapidissima TaxID=34773 RepID=UPI001C0960B4|nr:secretory calcium-binding phosphoprotein 9 [Alosa sapidissima]
MTFLLFLAAAVTFCNVTSAKKLALITGLNGGGVLTGLNGGLLTGLNGGLITGVNPGLVLNPGLLNGGNALIAQPQLAQMAPGVPFVMQPPQFGFPQAGAQQQQPPPQFAFPSGNGGFPYFAGFPQGQPGMFPPQQAAGGNAQQQQQQQPNPNVRRFKRMLRKLQKTSVGVTQAPLSIETTPPSPTPNTAAVKDILCTEKK